MVWKSVTIKRIFDEAYETLVFNSHRREVRHRSAWTSISTEPLFPKT
ncbi:CreA family protein [Actibacterium sp. 188UL27-1]|nr:CreA family protein [Actibacterium sp. 188UL27-1]